MYFVYLLVQMWLSDDPQLVSVSEDIQKEADLYS